MNTVQQLEAICDEDAGVRGYVQAHGGLEKARVDILHDFFKHAFDGSGADNFYDAGMVHPLWFHLPLVIVCDMGR